MPCSFLICRYKAQKTDAGCRMSQSWCSAHHPSSDFIERVCYRKILLAAANGSIK
jgi:hypothetical protein